MALGFLVTLAVGESVCKVRCFPGHYSKRGARIDLTIYPSSCNRMIDRQSKTLVENIAREEIGNYLL